MLKSALKLCYKDVYTLEIFPVSKYQSGPPLKDYPFISRYSATTSRLVGLVLSPKPPGSARESPTRSGLPETFRSFR